MTGGEDAAPVPDEVAWQRLDPRTIWASSVFLAGILAGTGTPVAIGLLLSGLGPGWTLFWVGGGVLVGTVATAVVEVVRLAVTRFRVDEHRIERRVQFLGSSTTVLSTQRIRNVEVAADLVQRRFGIAEVRLASGDSDGPRFTLSALDRSQAEELRARLLGDRATADTSVLATGEWGWLRFAPVTLWTPILGVFAFGAIFQVADWFQAVPAMLDWFREFVDGTSWWVVVLALLAIAVVIGTIGTIVIHVEEWWHYRLERQDDGSLELHRGLLIGRATHFDGRRIRGVRLHQPPGLRRVRAARLDVIAVGVSGGADESGRQKQSPALVPNAPVGFVTQVGETIAGTSWPESLEQHPPAALRRRLVRAVLTTAGVVLVAFVPTVFWPSLWWIGLLALAVAAPLSLWIALDNARGLGHRITDRHAALRRGSIFRRTDLMHREGLLGWNIRESPFQRRVGLVSLVATSAGGSGASRLPDVSGAQAAEVMGTAGPVWDHLRVVEPAQGQDVRPD